MKFIPAIKAEFSASLLQLSQDPSEIILIRGGRKKSIHLTIAILF